ncbi:MAG: ribose transport system ATP-binding protein [Frankiales bacterium]|jgi:ribose transport system ATP-binding protein|nr:ribose transport system ATP-binding protein [Frankiales bacterium]
MDSKSVTPAVSVTGLSKTFGTTRVLRDVALEIVPGEIHALVGENGSGKSTVVKILSGFHLPDDGSTVLIDGTELAFGSSAASSAAGLRFVHQDLGLVLDLSTVDNLALGNGYRTGFGQRIRWREEIRGAKQALDQLGYTVDITRPVAELTPSERTAVAIARAVAGGAGAKCLVLDEPTVNLPAAETQRLFDLLRRLRDTGVAIVFISHHFDEIFELADRVTVLRDGQWVATEPIGALTHDGLVELMLGRPLDIEHSGEATHEMGEVVLDLNGVSGASARRVDLEVHAGEVVGVAGITGSGREAVARMVAGGLDFRGELTLLGKRLSPNRPDLAFRSGLASVPADRRTNAVLPGQSIRENLTISRVSPYVIKGFLRRSRETSDVMTLLQMFDVRPRKPEADIGALSGGNQQKCMIARALRLNPRVLVLDEPTQGVDVGAQAAIHALILEAAAAGTAVLVCSSVSEELAEICDRVVVMSGGTSTKVLHRPLNPDQITAATLAVREERAK